jgi:thymidylate synthase (FAD)
MQLHTAQLDWITPEAERVIARHARVSTKNPDREEYEKLLVYCIKHGHYSVFEQASASFGILTTRAISPQILRHRSFVYQELSQRYTNPWETLEGEELEDPYKVDLRFQGKTNRQCSGEQLPLYLREIYWDKIKELDRLSHEVYNELLDAGVSRECSRNVLPLYTPTRMHMSGTIRSFIHYVGLRGKEDTQLEHRQIARAIGYTLANHLPVVVAAIKESEESSLSGWDFLKGY